MLCEENSCTSYFDGSFHVIKYPKGSKLYTGARFGREFAIGEKFYTPVDPAIPLPNGFERALIYEDKSVSLTFSEFYQDNIKTGWYSDPIVAECENCGISAYVLKRDAVFINIGKSEDVIKFIQPVVQTRRSGQSNFLDWLCSGVDNEIYAGYTLDQNQELFVCNALKYLERDLTNEIDWQRLGKTKEKIVNKYLDQLKLYKTQNVNIFAGDLYEQTVWTLLHLEDILSRPNKYTKFSPAKKTVLAAAAVVSKIGFLGEGSIQRQTDFIISEENATAFQKKAKTYLLGKENIPEFKVKENKLVPEKRRFSATTLLSKLGVSKMGDIVDISNLVTAHTVLFSMIYLYRQNPQKTVVLYIDQIKKVLGETPTKSFMYCLLALSVASIRAMQPPVDPREQSIYFPFVKNVPKKYRGGIISDEVSSSAIDKVKFVDDILSQMSIERQTAPNPVQIFLYEGDMWYKNRISIGKAIYQKIDSIEISQWKRCLSGDNSNDFKSKLGETFILGKGTFGQVYLSSIDTGGGLEQKIVIKEAILSEKDRKKMEPHTKNGFPQNSWPDEFKLLSLTKDILERKQSPNFLNVYHLSACEGCSITTLTGMHTGTCYTTFMEAADGDISSLPPHVLGKQNLQRSFVYQMMIALHIVQKEYGMLHRDIKKVNIMYQNTPQLEGQFFKYIVGDKEYLVENAGFVFYLADFGVSTLCKPQWALGDFYGERNGMVQRIGDRVELVPIVSEYLYYKDKKDATTWKRGPSPPLKWQGELTGTRNRVIKGHDPEFNIPVDLSNTQVFPSWQFNGDIQDIFRMVTGGDHSVQKGNHKGFGRVAINSMLKPVLTNKKYFELIWTKDMAHQVLAGEMMKKIYVEISDDVEIIDTFRI